MKIFYYIHLLPKDRFSPGVPHHHGECPLQQPCIATRLLSHNQPISQPFKIYSKCNQFSFPSPAYSKSLPPLANVYLLCHSLRGFHQIQWNPVALLSCSSHSPQPHRLLSSWDGPSTPSSACSLSFCFIQESERLHFFLLSLLWWNVTSQKGLSWPP